MQKEFEKAFAGLVLYEDDNIIVVDKPPFVASIPERKPTGLDVLSVLSRLRGQKLYVVHRLDKDVSGVMVFAKNPYYHRLLSMSFEKRLVEKTYVALVHGIIEKDEGVIDVPIRQFGSGRMGIDYKKGKRSVTFYKVFERFPKASMVYVFPETGRRHQIRVHFYHIGHPILGDLLYGKKSLAREYDRLFLHALSLKIKDEKGNILFSFNSTLPESFYCVIQKLKVTLR